MAESALTLMQTLADAHLYPFAVRLCDWLVTELNRSSEPVPAFTESRAKALLRAANVIDDPTLHSFARLMDVETAVAPETAVRLALYDLLNETNLTAAAEIQAIAAAATHSQSPSQPSSIPWLSLAVAAYAWKSEYPLHQLDPASPPGEFSPAGQVVKRAAFFLRQQVQRSATERDKLARKLAYAPPSTPSLEQLRNEAPIPPLPPHFRPPIPVRYPEVARETLQITPDEPLPPPPAPRSDPLTVRPEEMPGDSGSVMRMPPIRISEEQIPPERPDRSQAARTRRAANPPTNTPTGAPIRTTSSAGSFSDGVRQLFGRGREPMKSTKLRVLVTEYPDGPGIYGLQVKVSCQGVKSFVAGTTNRQGQFLCELPVRLHSGLTYDVDVSWPPELGGKIERKSITLHADRTEFSLPFFSRLNKESAS